MISIVANFQNSCIILHSCSSSSSVSTANLSGLPATTFSDLRFLFNSLSSARFNLLRVARRCFSCFSLFLFSRLILSLSLICYSVSEALLALSFSFLSEYFFLVLLKLSGVNFTLANGCNPTTSFAQAFQHASSNDIHSHDE